LGFIPHPKKSVTVPTQILVFLGFILNSINMTVSPTQEKIDKTVAACKLLLAKAATTIQQVAEVIGLLVSNFPGVDWQDDLSEEVTDIIMSSWRTDVSRQSSKASFGTTGLVPVRVRFFRRTLNPKPMISLAQAHILPYMDSLFYTQCHSTQCRLPRHCNISPASHYKLIFSFWSGLTFVYDAVFLPRLFRKNCPPPKFILYPSHRGNKTVSRLRPTRAENSLKKVLKDKIFVRIILESPVLGDLGGLHIQADTLSLQGESSQISELKDRVK
ncbi:Hypothetical predicted protein, partial [Paramuricea clavata]